ncbi:MAG: glucose-6-phosphate isomerase [Desulfobacca sp.]|uniref:glucose-6-phosphate isomerase n=1 Tax=Desulfobacca sp. TaxID=2067990 RepID=UPI004049FD99
MLQKRERGHQTHRREYEQTPLTIDYSLAMAEVVGAANGLSAAALRELEPRLQRLDEQLQTWRRDGTAGFCALPYDTATVQEIKGLAKRLKEWCRDALVVGLGGSAWGARALRQALLHPSHNHFPLGQRHYHSRLFIADNIEPDSLYGMLDGLELKRTTVNVISTSGETPETLALFLFIYQILENRLGAVQARESCVLTTDGGQGSLARLAAREGFPQLKVPPGVRGSFTILSAMGLFPAALAGIDIDGLLAGARFMDQRLQAAPVTENPACRLAAIYYLAQQHQGRRVQVIMPYADSLLGLAAWCGYLWAESLGKQHDTQGRRVNTSCTTLPARGATDQHSQLQLLLEGPSDKIVTFWEVAKFQQQISIPPCFADCEGLEYLAGQTLAGLLTTAKQATAWQLAERGCPNLTIQIPEINAFTIGQLIYLCQMTVVALGGLLEIDPFGQPQVEGLQRTLCGLLGRPGYEAEREALATFNRTMKRYVI